MFKKPLTFLIAFSVALTALLGCKGKEVVGTAAVDFTIERINGGQISYADLKGRPVLLYFFASW